MDKLKFIHHTAYYDHGEIEWYEVLHEGTQVLNIQRSSAYDDKWVAIDGEGKQCFEANMYRHDLFEQIKYEAVFE